MVIQPRDEIYEPLSVFRSIACCPRFTPQNRVIGDAALIAEVVDVDAQGRDSRAVPGAPAPPQVGAAAFSSSLPPTQREIEGVGGEMWYEARHFGAGRAA